MPDPTSVNIHGADVGTQYSSLIFFLDDEEKIIAEKVKINLNDKYKKKIVTNISKEKNYCKAEEYHQKYIQKNSL